MHRSLPAHGSAFNIGGKLRLFGESMLLKTFQYIAIAAGFSACMLFMLLLALTEPLI